MTARPHPLVQVVAPRLGLGPACLAVLDAIPELFGIREANAGYVAFVTGHPTWSAVDEAGQVLGVLAPLDHVESAEIYLIAVMPQWHRHGVGRALVAAFEAESIARGLRLAHVKTLCPSDPDEGYARTRRFYSALGYRELEEMLDLWPGDPALVMVKPLPEPSGETTTHRCTWPSTAPTTRASGPCDGVRRSCSTVSDNGSPTTISIATKRTS